MEEESNTVYSPILNDSWPASRGDNSLKYIYHVSSAWDDSPDDVIARAANVWIDGQEGELSERLD